MGSNIAASSSSPSVAPSAPASVSGSVPSGAGSHEATSRRLRARARLARLSRASRSDGGTETAEEVGAGLPVMKVGVRESGGRVQWRLVRTDAKDPGMIVSGTDLPR